MTRSGPRRFRKVSLGKRIVRAGRLFVPLLKATAAGWVENNAMRLSAALALYAILSLAPMLVITSKIVGSVITDADVAREQIAGQLSELMGRRIAEAIVPLLENGRESGGGVVATIVSTVILFFTATGVFAELQDSMNTIWGVKPKPNQGWGVWDFFRRRLISLAMVLGIGFLLLTSMFLTTVMVRLATYLARDTAKFAIALDPIVSFLVVTALFAAMFKFLPDVKLAMRHVWVGAALTAVLFTVGKYALAFYFNYATPTSAFGAAGSLVAVMLWVYYSSFILFFGAEFTKVWSLRHLREAVPPEEIAVPVTEEERAQKGIPSEERMKEALEEDERERAADEGGERSS